MRDINNQLYTLMMQISIEADFTVNDYLPSKIIKGANDDTKNDFLNGDFYIRKIEHNFTAKRYSSVISAVKEYGKVEKIPL